MIKKILILLLLTSSFLISGTGEWWQVTTQTHSSLNDVFFLNENLGWIVGADGTILRTTDGGHTWIEATDMEALSKSLYSIYFVSENIGYAGGVHDLLIKTTDGGATWSEVTFDAGDGTVYSIYFENENIGWALSGVSKGGTISHTTDGGANWTTQATETTTPLKSMSFSSSGHGVCAGGKKGKFAFYYTTDGTTWVKAPTPTGIPGVYSKTDINTVAMASNDVACASGWGSPIGLQPTFTIRTLDGGANWVYQTQAEEDRLYVNMYGMMFKDELNGIAVGGSSYKGTVLYKTTDGGLNWKEANCPMGFQGKAVNWVNNKICIVGSGGGIAVSDDAGVTWSLETEIVNSTLKDIKRLPNGNIISAGFYGACIVSSDGGATWKSSYAADQNVSPTIENLFFLNENIGYAAQRNRMISKTTDGGNTWTQIMKDTNATSFNNYGVQFLSEDVGFVVGKYGSGVSAFFTTTNGGTTWSSQIAKLPDELNALHFFDANNGVVVGDESVLSYTTDGGTTWNSATVNNAPSGSSDFFEVEFYDNNFGLVCGDVLLKTNDAGKTWNYVDVTDLPRKIKACEIVNAQTWYLAGDKYLLKTTDAGATWTDVVDLTIVTARQTYDVMVDAKGYPWLACGSSSIYTPSPKVSVKQIDNNIPNEFNLEANYPNPFNPTTKIKYSIPVETRRGVSQQVVLKVYNLLGQEVATLVNETQKSGTYEVEFNAKELTSGIYIYTLQNAGYLQSRKMLLVK